MHHNLFGLLPYNDMLYHCKQPLIFSINQFFNPCSITERGMVAGFCLIYKSLVSYHCVVIKIELFHRNP